MNINLKDRQTLKELASSSSIIIKPADKGGNIVVMDIVDYRQEILRQLSNPVYYQKVPSDPTKHLMNLITIMTHDGVILSYIQNYMAAFRRAHFIERQNLLQKKEAILVPKQLSFLFDFIPRVMDVRKIIYKHWHIVQQLPGCSLLRKIDFKKKKIFH